MEFFHGVLKITGRLVQALIINTVSRLTHGVYTGIIVKKLNHTNHYLTGTSCPLIIPFGYFGVARTINHLPEYKSAHSAGVKALEPAKQ